MSFNGEGSARGVWEPVFKTPVVSQLLTAQINPGQDQECLSVWAQTSLTKWWSFPAVVDIKILRDEDSGTLLIFMVFEEAAALSEITNALTSDLNALRESQAIGHFELNHRSCELIE